MTAPKPDRRLAAAEPIARGARASTLAQLGQSLKARDITEAEILATLITANAQRCRPPLGDDAVRAIAHQVVAPADISTRRRMQRWLQEFRVATPRDARQTLIDGATPEALLRELEGLPLTARAGRWPFVVYLLAARALQGPALADDDLVGRLAAVFAASPDHLRTDIRRMAAELVRNHRRWEHVKAAKSSAFLERQQKRAQRAASLAPGDTPTPDLEARR